MSGGIGTSGIEVIGVIRSVRHEIDAGPAADSQSAEIGAGLTRQ